MKSLVGLPGRVARNCAAVVAQVVGNLNGVILNCHIEVVERDDEHKIDDGIGPARGAERPQNRTPHRVHRCIVKVGEELCNGGGDHGQRRGKMMGITPLIFTLMGMWLFWPPYILRPTTRLAILHRNAALGCVQNHNEHQNHQRKHQNQRHKDEVLALAIHGKAEVIPHTGEQAAPAGDNAGKNSELKCRCRCPSRRSARPSTGQHGTGGKGKNSLPQR